MQIVNSYTIIFTTEHTLYTGATITIEFPTKIILPPTGSTVVILPQGDSKSYIVANTGFVESGNIISINDIFGTENPPTGPLTITIIFEGI